ncbi:protein of unknown function [Mucilaginibacter pineti]|uniref:3-keto-alpha-glucoside-1,2-lyase/3-keto-2-hydroxy-glucal hydratase domain-containing protein n=1 Tax=Mucilaginibacter pineti TaxID=1391627 RepID=A0A1G7DT73_9SPHI|nr:DUF1080 domain-containing protein [Mucilaginibacter pineti]SDE54678.1 protein of unknown function [Mucilaginibacter pineti]
MKKLVLSLMAVSALHFAVSAQTKPLFDGKTTTGWHIFNKTGAGGWKVVDGALQLDPAVPDGGDLITDGEYENYELTLEWSITKEGNSGIIFGVKEDPKFGATYQTGIEMQVLDDIGADDNKQTNHLAGSLYDLKTASVAAKPAGEWNKIKLRKKDGHITFWMNGKQSLDIQMGSDEWKELLGKSKFKNWKDFAAYPKGHIALQDHGHVVSYRKIKIKEL